MKKQNIKSKKGFTIIEVVLVLAIAGLIFLMVFVALPALQGSQRDTQRRNDLARVATALNQYQTNNGGRLPNEPTANNPYVDNTDDPTRFIGKYLKADGEGEFEDPTGEAYTITVTTEASGAGQLDGNYSYVNDLKRDGNDVAADPDAFRIMVYTKAKCSDDSEYAEESENKRDYAIVFKLERSGTYCADNQ